MVNVSLSSQELFARFNVKGKQRDVLYTAIHEGKITG